MAIFIFRGVVVSRIYGFLSSVDLHLHLSQLADYYGVLDTDIIVIHC